MSDQLNDPGTLSGRFVRLEPLQRHHLDGLLKHGLDPRLHEWTVDRIDDRDQMLAWIDDAIRARELGWQIPFVTVDAVTDDVAGSTRFLNIEWTHRRAEIGGTRLGIPWQRSPFNTEAKFLMLRQAFDVWKLNRVEFKTDALNQQSRAALARLGAREEGTLRRHMVTHSGRVRDSIYFSIVIEEWPQVRDRLARYLDRPWYPPADHLSPR